MGRRGGLKREIVLSKEIKINGREEPKKRAMKGVKKRIRGRWNKVRKWMNGRQGE